MVKNSILLFICFFLSFCAVGQELKFSNFSIKDGLNDPFVYAIANDSRGYLSVGTGEGLGVFDGQKFQMKYVKDGLAEDFVSSLYLSSNDVLWIGHKEGGLSQFMDGKFSVLNNEFNLESVITGIFEDSKGMIWVSSQSHGIITINPNNKIKKLSGFEDKIIHDIFISDFNMMFVSTDMGLELYDVSGGIENITFQELILEDLNVIKAALWDEERLIIGTNSSGIYQYNLSSGSLQKIEIPKDVIIKDILIDKDRNILISSINQGLLRIDLDFQVSIYNDKNGLDSKAINYSFVDREGILWLGSYGEGLFKHHDEIFTNYFTVKGDQEGGVRDIFIENKYKYFLYDSSVIRINLDAFDEPDTFNLRGVKNFNSIWVNEDHHMFIGTNQDGVYKIDPLSDSIQEIYYSNDALSKNVSDIVGVNDILWVGSFNGVFKIDLNKEQTKKFDISKGLSHNSVNTLFYEETSERLFIGCKSSRLNFIDADDKVQGITYFESTKVYNVYDIATDLDNQLILATYGDGLLIQDNDAFYAVSSTNGLLSNFCYGISIDFNNDVWVTHNGGLSRLNLYDGNLKVYSEKESVGYRFVRGAISRDRSFVWFGTSTGVLKFDGAISNNNKVPPKLHIESILINGKEIEIRKNIELRAGTYDFKFVAKGLSIKNPDKVQYKYKLEGYNQDWSDVSTDNRFNLTKVPDGEYQLKIVAYNIDMVGSEESEVYLNILIKTPYWKKYWFWILIIFGILAITFIYIKYRENQFKFRQQKLEEQLDIRTKEVTEQKDKVLLINKDITDSINYARRIQDALLPNKKNFKERFPGSFVIYKPRDIVSGDFYWTNSTSEKFLIGCGDCTGHGVPGAFMSLLGQQMLKEIYSIKNIEEPDKILLELNREIRSLLSDDSVNQDEYLMVDGMDIIITEFDFDKMILKWSSAIRPLVRYRDSKREYLKGSRNSIGSASPSANFKLNTEKLIVGDMLYMFSDGFPDQFGGPTHKKLKTSGMFKILDAAQEMSIEDQKEFIDNQLMDWIGTHEQTDDIIIIGIKI